ncbi:C40 family peptidase [Peribacillus sp. SCS-155]|uniref:C40 family peptidase n=1 Tax=Peribacillus sedimenti TaxID=3115297 RepID=UPI0039057A08
MFKKFIATLAMTATLSIGFTAVGDTQQAEAASYHTKAISVAKSNLGVKYKWGGITPSGFDCSGLLKYSFAKAGKTLPRTARDMYTKGTRVSSSSLKPGDLLFYAPTKASRPTHVAMYVGSGKVINSSSSKGVSYFYTNNSYWKPKFLGAKRI